MQVTRYIRAYHKQTGIVAFTIELPENCLTFLSVVDFLRDDIDPLLYACYELTKEQTDYLFSHWHLLYEADTDYFDYFLECESVSKIKTKSYFNQNFKGLNTFVTSVLDDDDFSEGSVASSYLEQLQNLGYQIYLQGVNDGKL